MISVYIMILEVLVPTLLASVYGFAVIMHRHKGLYYSMGVFAVFCMFLGQLSYLFSLYTGNQSNSGFHIGTLGAVGSSLFFMTANRGSINKLVDADRENLRKCRCIAALGPVLLVLIYAACFVFMKRKGSDKGLVVGAILTVLSLPPVYFSLKATVIQDVENGFFDCMRPYNFMATVIIVFSTLERSARNLWGESLGAYVLSYVFYGALGLCAPVALLFMERGARKWKSI